MNDIVPSLTLTSITLSCPDTRALVAFYARLLKADVVVDDDGWGQIRTGRVGVNFEHERHWTRPTWPAVEGHQTATQHLDIHVDDLASATVWAVECGATMATFQPQDDVRVLFDPSGHPFCLFL